MTDTQTRRVPVRSRPLLPDGYGVPTTDEGMLDWSWGIDQLEKARNYWFCTTRPDARPHAMPAWAVWIDDTLYFDGSPETRRGRNLALNPAITVHLESGDHVLVLEGLALDAPPPTPEFGLRLASAFEAKYGESHDYHPEPTSWDSGGLWFLRPKVAFGWDKFPTGLTRWRFS